MQFDSSYITTAGSELFARATASTNSGVSSPVVWGSVYTSKTDMRSLTQEEMRALTSIPENERSSSGSVTSARHDVIDGNHIVKLECEINNKQYSGIAYAIGVYARLDSDSNEVLAAIARVDTNGSTPDTIQSSGEYLAIIDFAIAIRDDQLNIQKVDSSYYASAKSMQDLANRVVTTHVESDVKTGEEQEVYGNKYFQNGIMLNGQDGRSCITFTDIYGTQDIACEISINPRERGLAIVSGNHLFNDTDRIVSIELDNGTGLFDITRQRASYHVHELYVDQVVTNSLITESDDITLKSTIVPENANSQITLGTQDVPFARMYCRNYSGIELNVSTANANDVKARNTIEADTIKAKNRVRTYSTDNKTNTTAGIDLTTSSLLAFKNDDTSATYSTMYASTSGFNFCVGSVDLAQQSMSITDKKITTDKSLYINEGAILKKDKALMCYGKVVCDTTFTEQIMLGVPDTITTEVENEDSAFVANVPVGSIIMLYGDVRKLSEGTGITNAIRPGEHLNVNEHEICIAMTTASAGEDAVPNYTYCGASSTYQTATGQKKVYAPVGTYVALMGASAPNTSNNYVALLALRID